MEPKLVTRSARVARVGSLVEKVPPSDDSSASPNIDQASVREPTVTRSVWLASAYE